MIAALAAGLLFAQSIAAKSNATCSFSQGTWACKEQATKGLPLIQLRPEFEKVEMHEEMEASYSPAVFQRRMPAAGAATTDSSGCPHEENLAAADNIFQMNAGKEVVLPAGKYILRNSASIKWLTIPKSSELIFDDAADLVLTVEGVHVLGTLRLGAKTCPLKSGGIGITFVGSGDLASRSADPLKTKGLTVGDGGRLEMFGTRFAPTWTRLAASAAPGSTEVQLADDVDWQVGQHVVVVTTSWIDEPENHQNEVRKILAVDGRKLTLDSSLGFGHYGGAEYAAEVALLSRTITMQGDDSSEESHYGGHLLCGPGSLCQIGGVAAYRMGQKNVMGRYPFHLHMMGDVSDQQGAAESYFEDCLVWHGYFRAFTIHGTSGSRASRNVAYDIMGSAYYLEDGIEENNLFEFNLAALVNIIDKLDDYDNGGGQGGAQVSTQASRIVPTDATAVGFYCTNANNRWIGNSASGGFSGFHFPQVPNVLGASYSSHKTYEPEAQELLEFDSNTAHSSGRHWKAHGSCIYVGGKLWENQKGSQDLSYRTGRVQPARKGGRFIFTNTKVFACNRGTLFWGTFWTANKPDFALEGFEAHDVRRSSSQLGDTYMIHAVISAQSDNAFASDLPTVAEGFELYDTDMQTVLVDITFRNFNRPKDVAIMDMTHSNIYKPQGMFHSKDLQFEGTPRSQRFRHVERRACKSYHQDSCLNNCAACPGTPGSSQTANMIDVDGSGVGWNRGGAILGADDTDAETNARTNDWWRLDDDCVAEVGWGFWVCPTFGQRTIVSLFIVKGITSGAPERTTASTAVGQLFHFGHEDRHLDLGLAESPMVTGPCCDIGWFMSLDAGAEAELTIFLDQMVTEGGLVFATAYPQGADLAVQRCLPSCTTVEKASSLQDMLGAPGTLYFVNEHGVLFLKFVFEENGVFEAGGVKQLVNGNRYYHGQGARYTIRSSKSGSVGTVDALLPPALQGVATTLTTTPVTTPAVTTTAEKATTHAITTTTAEKTTTSFSSTTTSEHSQPEWESIDGGVDRACRGATSTDNAGGYYSLITGMASLDECKAACVSTAGCQGVEYDGKGRCEVWLRPGGIQATSAVKGFTCLRYSFAVTTTSLPMETFEPVDGGDNRACRGGTSTDNSASHYTAYFGVSTLFDCKVKCASTAECKGIEYNSGGRCEVWTRADGIQASSEVTGFMCLRYGLLPTTTMREIDGLFLPVDGGDDRVCRGATSNDNSASYFTPHFGVATLDDCKAKCASTSTCKGIEFRVSRGRCEVWTRPEGIQASRVVSGYLCFQYTAAPLKTTSTPSLSTTSETECADAWKQCGGKTWTGPACCLPGYVCRVGNEWYSQCKPA
eukprot:TRINITY_DN76319_c0_g1_i1.p1 TRINITY_DN76319_c0_g1~~TRINITY_DN76319_c0_g1_i1.p1  ORF type:complete len:1365 (+),score=211.34 TRINITY_DN76319_c0_g1_i1:65-4096(+)